MGVAEEGAKVAGGFISALGSQPVLLVQSLIIAGVVFILYAQGTRSFTEREVLTQSIFESQKHVREILSQCIVPPDDRRRGETSEGKRVVEWPPLPRTRPPEAGSGELEWVPMSRELPPQ